MHKNIDNLNDSLSWIDGWIFHSCRVAALQKSLGTLQIFDLNLLNPDKKGKIERQLMGFNTKKGVLFTY